MLSRSGEMANTLRSGRSELTLLWVQVPPSADYGNILKRGKLEHIG